MKTNGPYTVLVADDDPSIRVALRATLEADGFVVVDVNDGRAAMAELAKGGVDVAILDLAMPQLDGLGVLREMRQNHGLMDPPVLILTAYDSVTAAMESARRGAVGFLCKPITHDALCAAVREAIAKGGAVSPPVPPPVRGEGEPAQ